MTKLYGQLIGIPWYRAERYDDARARMADADRLPPTYDLWRERAEQREHQVRREGNTPSRVYVDDEMFLSFATGPGPDGILDSKTRQAFAAVTVARGAKANIPDYDLPGFRHGAARRK